MRIHALPVFAAALLGACAAVDFKHALTADELGRIHRIGVISLVGDDFHGTSVGKSMLHTTEFSAWVPDWNLDATLETQAVAALQDEARFATAPIRHRDLGADQLRADHAQVVWELAAHEGFDTVVSLWPSVSKNFPFFKPGYGLFERSLLGDAERCLYAAYTVEVYDVATRQRIAWEWGGDMPCRMGSAQQIPFRENFADYAPAERQAMRVAIEARIGETLAPALGKLGLVARVRKGQ